MYLSISKKIILTLAALVLISTGTTYFVATYNYSNTLQETLNDDLFQAQEHFEHIRHATQNENLRISKLAAYHEDLAGAILNNNLPAIKSMGQEIMKSAGVTLVTITNDQGIVLTRAHNEKQGDSIINQETISLALKGQATSGIVEGVVAPVSLRATSPIVYNGKTIGTISVGNSLENPNFIDWLGEFLGVRVTFFKDSTRMMTNIKDEQGKRIVGTQLNNPTIEAKVLKDGEIYFGKSTIMNVEYLAAYWPARTHNRDIIGMWFMGLPVSDVFQSEQNASQNTILFTLAVVAIMLGIAAYVGYYFALPVKKLARYAEKVVQGKKDIKCPTMHRNDEFDILAHSLHDMVENLKKQADWYESILNSVPSPLAAMDVDRNFVFVNTGVCNMLGKKPEELIGLQCYNWGASICRTENCAIESCERGINNVNFEQPGLGHFQAMAARLNDPAGNHIGYVDMVFDRNQEVKLLNDAEQALVNGRHEAANQLENIVQNIAAISVQLTEQIDISAAGADRAAMRMTETAAAMDEMNSTVLEVARNSNASAELAENTKHKASEGTEIINKTENTMVRLRDESLAVRVSMGELAGHAQSISTIMGVISDIADQTNLLALNAAIEAARAGDAGRGFAVVADEVRKLAEKTMSSTTDVSSAINSIQQSTEVNVKQIDSTVKFIEEAAGLAIKSGESLSVILDMAEESADGIRAIATASEEQSATSDEITRSITDVSSIVNDTTAAMTQAHDAVQSLSEQSKQLSDLIDELKS